MKLIRPLLLLCCLLAVQSTFAQGVKEKVADDACECLHEKKKANVKDVEAATEQCIESAVLQNLDVLAAEYGMENLDGALGEEFGEELGATLVAECPLFMEMIMESQGIGTSETSKFEEMKSPTVAKASAKSCKCISKLKNPDENGVTNCVTTYLEKFEKKFVKENGKKDLSSHDMDVIAEQTFDNLNSTCPSFKAMDFSSGASTSSADLAENISNDACDCFNKVDLDQNPKDLDAASEKCIENATLNNMDIIMAKYGENVADDDFADKLLEDIGSDLMVHLVQNCPRFMEIIQRVED